MFMGIIFPRAKKTDKKLTERLFSCGHVQNQLVKMLVSTDRKPVTINSRIISLLKNAQSFEFKYVQNWPFVELISETCNSKHPTVSDAYNKLFNLAVSNFETNVNQLSSPQLDFDLE